MSPFMARRHSDGVPVALAIHLGMYCAVAVFFAFGVYEFMQPTRNTNPGLAAYEPPPATVVTYNRSFVQKYEPAVAVAAPADAALETDGVNPPSPAPAQSKPTDREVRREKPKRPQPVYRSEQRDPIRNYAAQRLVDDRYTRPWY
jgi:hypothetical protein